MHDNLLELNFNCSKTCTEQLYIWSSHIRQSRMLCAPLYVAVRRAIIPFPNAGKCTATIFHMSGKFSLFFAIFSQTFLTQLRLTLGSAEKIRKGHPGENTLMHALSIEIPGLLFLTRWFITCEYQSTDRSLQVSNALPIPRTKRFKRTYTLNIPQYQQSDLSHCLRNFESG